MNFDKIKFVSVIRYIHNPYEEIQKIAVQQNSKAIQYIHNPTINVQIMAIQRTPKAIQWIHNPSKEIIRIFRQKLLDMIIYTK